MFVRLMFRRGLLDGRKAVRLGISVGSRGFPIFDRVLIKMLDY